MEVTYAPGDELAVLGPKVEDGHKLLGSALHESASVLGAG